MDFNKEEITVTTEIDHDRGTITTAIDGVYKTVIQTKEEMIQNALIELGWTPPGKKMKHLGLGFYRLKKD